MATVIARQGPTVHAVGAGGVAWPFFFVVFLSLRDGPIQTEILTQRAVKFKITNQRCKFLVYLDKETNAIFRKRQAYLPPAAVSPLGKDDNYSVH